VPGEVYYVDERPVVFIKPWIFNEHVSFNEFLNHVKGAGKADPGGAHIFYVEGVGYQKAAIQDEMERNMLAVVAMRPVTDKRSRPQVVAPYIKSGAVRFLRIGAAQLLQQVFGLGVESHDDLCDGLTTPIQGLVDDGLDLPKVHWLDIGTS
jgi:hypothetical protein